MKKNRYEVTYEYGNGTRASHMFELYSEFEAQSAVNRYTGRHDIRILNVRRL